MPVAAGATPHTDPSVESLMRSAFVLVALLFFATATPARAQGGINLFWNGCSDGGATTRTFACNSVGAGFTLDLSVVVPHDMPRFAAATARLDFILDAAVIPPWWEVWPGGCRAGQLGMTFDPYLNVTNCYDLWQATPTVSTFEIVPGSYVPNQFRVTGTGAVLPGGELHLLADGTELWFAKITILRGKTVGPTVCEGCLVGACVRLNDCHLQQADGLASWIVSNPAQNNWVSWQSGYPTPCLLYTPAANRTWGAVKGLYR